MSRRNRKDATASAASDKLLGAVNRCFSTEDGKHVLQWLFINCGWDETSVLQPTPGVDILLTTYYNEARRAVYGELRSMIHNDILKDVEFIAETETQNEEEP